MEMNESFEQEVLALRQQIAQLEQNLAEAQQAEQRSRQTAALYRTMLDAIPSMVYCKAKDSRLVYVNRAFQEFYGMTLEEMVGTLDSPKNDPEYTQKFMRDDAWVFSTGQVLNIPEEPSLRYDGEERWLQSAKSPLLDENGQITSLVGVSSDITERRNLEIQLRESRQVLQVVNEELEARVEARTAELRQTTTQLEQSIQALHRNNAMLEAQREASLDGILFVDEHRNTLFFNQLFLQYWQIPEAVAARSDDQALLAFILDQLEQPETYLALVEYLYQHPDEISSDEIALKGGRILERRSVGVLSPKGEYYGRIWYFRDITDRKQTEAQLHQQKRDLENTLQVLQQAQIQLIQSEKMSSLGQLVAGVAHEINNPVNFIYGNLAHANEYIQDLIGLLKLYQQHNPNPHPEVQAEADAIDLDFLLEDLPKLLNSMRVGADRIQQIVASLRTFSRMDEADMKAVDIHEGIDSTLMILQNRIKAKSDRPEIKIVKEYGSLPLIECYAGQLNQVFMNILSNAIDALEEAINTQDGFHPIITIRTTIVNEKYVEIDIADNGLGIAEAVRQNIFNPFFTTKPIGKGTGMGLSISHQIVAEKHGGSLECCSDLGAGTEFVIKIPMQQSAVDSKATTY
jgi:two-component system, NtrC family, sensor kinase